MCSENVGNSTKGFYDPAAIYPKYKGEPDTNRLAVANADNPHLSLELRKLSRITGVPTADFDLVAIQDHISTEIPASDGDTWKSTRSPICNASYPFNHVYRSESGHIREYDDTKGNERIYEAHRVGTSYEISPDGTKTDIIKGDHYTIKYGKSQAVIDGQSDITIGGDTNYT